MKNATILFVLLAIAFSAASQQYNNIYNPPNLTGLTGGGATNLDGVLTENLPVGSMISVFDGTETRMYCLTAGTDAEDSPAVVRPDDFSDPDNAKVWKLRISSDPEETGYSGSGDDGDWTIDGDDIYNANTGNVSIGTSSSTHSLTVQNSSSDDVLRLIGPDAYGHGARLNFGDGDFVFIEESNDDEMLIYAGGVGNGIEIYTGGSRGDPGDILYSDGQYAYWDEPPLGGSGNWSRTGSTLFPSTPNDNIDLSSTTGDAAIVGRNEPSYDIQNYGYLGSPSHGVYGSGYSVGGACYGVYGTAFTYTGEAYGVYGAATAWGSGNPAFAGYFEGDGYFSGNVGIGTVNPVDLLSVEAYDDTVGDDDSVYISVRNSCNSDSALAGIRFKSHSTDGNSLYKSAIVFQRTNTYGRGNILFLNDNQGNSSNADLADVRMTIQPGGNIGIGTTAPGGKMEIYANSGGTWPQLLLKENSAGFARLFFANTDTTAFYALIAKPADNPANAKMKFYYGDDIMTIQGDGKVGIGTDSPNTMLTISGTTPEIQFIDTDTTNKWHIGQNSGSFFITETGIAHRLAINAGGNVGIGTTTPGAKTEIYANSGGTWPQLLLKENGADYARLFFANTDTTEFWGIVAKPTDDPSNAMMNFWYCGNRMTIRGDGNVGIGTTAPTSKLQVNGGIASQNGKVRRDFITYCSNTSSVSENTPIHIKTNIARGSGIMYRFQVEGYHYGYGRIINSVAVGATSFDSGGIYGDQTQDYSNGADISLYYSTDNYVVVKLTFPNNSYRASFSVSAWFTSVNGSAWDIQAEVFQQSSNL